MALSSVFLTGPAIRLVEKLSSARALSTFLPRIRAATRFSFWPEPRSMRRTALASLSLSARLVFGLLILLPLGLLVGRVTVVGTGRCELAKLVADHLFRDSDRDMLVAVVDTEGEANELPQEDGTTAPHLDHFVAAAFANLVGLLEQVAVDERTLPERTSHGLAALLQMAAANDELVRRLIAACLLALGRLAPRSNRVAAARRTAFAAAMRGVDR